MSVADLQERLLLAPALAFLLETMFAGPVGLVAGLPLRHLLFLAACGGLLLLLVLQRGRLAWPQLPAMAAVAAFLAWNLVWMSWVPLARQGGVGLALADADALLLLVLVLLYVGVSADRPRFLARLQRVVVAGGLALALLQAGLWCLGTVRPEWQGPLRALMTGVYNSEAVYVGPMPDGFFRVFWIQSLWVLLALFWLPTVLHAPLWRLTAGGLLLVGLFASYSRGLWLGLVAGGLVYLLMAARSRLPTAAWGKVAGLLLAVAVAAVLAAGAGLGQGLAQRTQSLGDRADPSLDARLAQVGPLLDAWRGAPVLGQGYGAAASLVRDSEAPFSYELVPLALLMKLGVVGVAGYLLLPLLVLTTALRARSGMPGQASSLAGGLTALWLCGMSNPLLMNFVGMSVLGALLVQWAFLRVAPAAAPALRVPA